MPHITDLPIEVMASVLRKLGNIRFLPTALVTCRHFYNSAIEHPGIAQDIIRGQITPALLPYSVALLESSRLPKPLTSSSINEMLDTLYNEPVQLEARLKKMPQRDLVRLGHLHDVINGFTTDFTRHAWSLLSQSDLVLSSTEHFRVCRAFYRYELLCNLFRSTSETSEEGFERRLFLGRHAPWENEQIGCVHDFLEQRLTKATFLVLSQDIDFGEVSIDYITCGGENYWKQQWLSQGLLYLHRLISESSDDSKKVLLNSALASPGAKLHDALNAEYADDVDSDTALGDYSSDELAVLNQHPDENDMDPGPYEAWYAAHVHLPAGAWVMFPDNAGRRERAYVLWDGSRIQQYKLLEEFENAAEPSYVPGDVETMEKSFEERSKIWQQGGTGYWSPGDTSRIVWPKKP